MIHDDHSAESARRILKPNEAETSAESHLSPELQELVRSEAFKSWFGDWQHNPDEASKVVDENGEPLLVYKGAPAGITQFHGDARGRTGGGEVGFYATKRRSNAVFYAQTTMDPETDTPLPASVYGLFLNIRRPLVTTNSAYRSQVLSQVPVEYDGIINDSGAQEIVVFDPAQILIATEDPVE